MNGDGETIRSGIGGAVRTALLVPSAASLLTIGEALNTVNTFLVSYLVETWSSTRNAILASLHLSLDPVFVDSIVILAPLVFAVAAGISETDAKGNKNGPVEATLVQLYTGGLFLVLIAAAIWGIRYNVVPGAISIIIVSLIALFFLAFAIQVTTGISKPRSQLVRGERFARQALLVYLTVAAFFVADWNIARLNFI